jgi:hypothetical protein
MACNKDSLTTYAVYEYDVNGTPIKSDKTVSLNMKPSAYPKGLVVAFFEQMFGTINTASGYSCCYDGSPVITDIITITWRKPTWKLVKIS